MIFDAVNFAKFTIRTAQYLRATLARVRDTQLIFHTVSFAKVTVRTALFVEDAGRRQGHTLDFPLLAILPDRTD